MMKKSSVSRAIQKFEKQDDVFDFSKSVQLRNKRLLFGKNNQYEIRIADTRELKEEAYGLTYKTYLEKGFIKENNSKMWSTDNDLKDSTITLVVLEQYRVIGTLTLVFDSKDGLPACDLYYREISKLRRNKYRLAELVSLAVDSRVRGATEIIAKLFNMAYIISKELMNRDYFIITINPRHAFFYIKKLSFNLFGKEKPCPKVSGAPANLLGLPLSTPGKMISNYHVKKIKSKTIYDQFISPRNQRLIIPVIRDQMSKILNRAREEGGMYEYV